MGRRFALALAAGLAAAASAPAPGRCNGPAEPIHALAGGGARAARVRGVVTAVMPGLRGFFVEAPRARWDSDPATPEGLFVYTGHRRRDVKPGEVVVLSGRYHRFHGMPELSRADQPVRCGRAGLPPPVPYGPAGDRGKRLGMRVRVAAPVAVDDLHDFGRYGEVRVSTGGRRRAPTAMTLPGPGAAGIARAETARSLWLDDASTRAHPGVLALGGHRFDARHPLRAGQRLAAVTGLAYHAFGRDLLEVQSLRRDAGANPRRSPASLHLPGGPRLVSFNVENYFNHARHGAPFPTERGARTAAQFRCQTRKLVAALAGLRPAVAALQEIENDGYGRDGAIRTFVRALDAAVPKASYRFVDPGTPRLGTDLIAPALVYDARAVKRVGRVAVLAAPPDASPAIRAGLKRPALAASFRVRATGRTLTVAVVHLRSKLSSCGRGLDSYTGAGHCAGARTAAARRVAAWLDGDPTGVKTAAVALAGDFNAYPHERAVTALEASGWRRLPPGSGYTENASGGVGDLDYVFASPGLAKRIRGATVWHGDADEAPAFGYAGRPACKGPAAPFRASDHDPVIVVAGGG